MPDDSFVDNANARTKEYADQLDEIAAAGVCPFCPENFRWHPNPIITTIGDWFVTAIREHYPGAQEHFLIICRLHKERLNELTSVDMDAVLELAKLVAGDVGGGGLTLRFGESKFTGATVRHLHFHVIIPAIDPETGRATPVYFPIG